MSRAAPALSGLLLAVSFPPFDLLLPPFVALVPFLLFVEARGAGPAGRWDALRGGLLLGVVYFALLLYWLLVALAILTKLAVVAYALVVLVLAGLTAAFGAALHLVRERTPAVPLPLAAATLWTAAEWVQGHLGDFAFPWLGLGMALAPFPTIAGAAELVGARGLTFWIVLVNGLIASGILAWRAGRPLRRTAALTAAVVALPAGFGVWRAATIELRPVARVAVVQPNIPEELKLDRAAAVDSTIASLRTLMSRIPPGSVDLVVWPEITFPAVLEEPAHSALRDSIRAMSARAGAPIVVGAYGAADRTDEAPLHNSAFIATAAGALDAAYHKRRLVPFVERIPFGGRRWAAAFFDDARYFGGLAAGRDAPAFGNDGKRYGILICFESIFADEARALRRAGADFIVNLTNDAWFGGEAWYSRTTGLWQHPAHLRLRAIELRVGVARVANTGFSLFVDPLGRVYERTGLAEADVRVATVYTTDGATLFARWGDWVGALAALGAGFLMLLASPAGAAYLRLDRVWIRRTPPEDAASGP